MLALSLLGQATPSPYLPGAQVRHILVPDPDPLLGHRNRTYEVTVPTAPANGAPMPVLFYLHGQSSDLQGSRTFAELGEASGQFVTVAPKGLSEGIADAAAWEVGAEGRTDVCANGTQAVIFPSCVKAGRVSRCNWATCHSDLAFMRLLLEEVRRDLAVDPARFYASGCSNGAMLALHLAAELPGAFAAIVPWYGTYLKGQLPNDARLLAGTSLLYMQGGRDTTIPEAGGESYDHYLYEVARHLAAHHIIA